MHNIWLYYVSIPTTTAVYYEKSFRKFSNLTTIGPTLPDQVISEWNLEDIKPLLTPQDIETEFNADLEQFYNKAEKKPDFFIWIEAAFGDFPINIKNLPIPKAGIFIDTHLHLKEHLIQAQNFDYVFLAQKEYILEFKKNGINNVFWLPLGADIEIHRKYSTEKKHDIGFVGSIVGNPRRAFLIEKLKESFNLYYERSFLDKMAKTLGESKIVFNNAVRNDLNMRVFEVMSIGSLLLTDNPQNSGQEELFVNHEDFVVYNDSLIEQSVNFYLENPNLRELIAKRGKEIVHNAHLYEHRAKEVLDILLQKRLTTSSAKELRKKSLQNISVTSKQINKLKRSFIIPVIDYAPASQYNIKTLLDDLENIEGEIIVIFNSEQVANEIKNDSRIDQYAIMKNNVGVSRAWNIGLNIARTPISFIINSDVHVGKQTIADLEDALISFPDAAIVGPQGSFFHYDKLQDLQYFQKGEFDKSQEVDAVSGFLFATLTKYFHQGKIIFENSYTPCYFEEWDLGLQIRKNGLKSFVVPTKDFEHEWSGSIKSMRTIKYYDKEETAGEIWKNNRQKFIRKWDEIISKDNSLNFLKVSLFVGKTIQDSLELISKSEFDKAEKIYRLLIELYPNNEFGYLNLALVQKTKGQLAEAKSNFQKIISINPDNKTAIKYLEEIKS